MTFYEITKQIERFGCTGNQGQTIYGTSALLRFLALGNTELKDLDYANLDKAKRFVDRHKAEPVKC